MTVDSTYVTPLFALANSPQGEKMDFSKSKYPDVQKSERPNVQLSNILFPPKGLLRPIPIHIHLF
jgi:hypothetical protein